MEPRLQNLTPNPQADANCLSKLSFWWTHHVLRLGYQHRLDEVDIYDVLPEDSSIKLANKLGRQWEKEHYKFKTGGTPSLFRAIYSCYGVWVLATGLVFLLEEGLRLSQAVFLALIISYFEPASQMSRLEIYMYALGWSLSYLFVILLDNIAFHKSFYLGLKMRVACTSLIYRKLLRLNQSSLHNLSSQNIVTLFSIDAHRFDQSCLGISYIWIAPLEITAIVLLLWIYFGLGPYCLIGVAMILLLSPIQLAFGRYLTKLRMKMSGLTDRRMRAMSEIISGITSIKVNCWEKPFTTLVQALRGSEWLYLRGLSHCRSLNSAVYFCSGKLVMLGTFLAYVFMGNTAPPSVIFPTLALFDILRASVGLLLPWGVQHALEVRSAIARLQSFLLLEERNVIEAPTHLNILNIGRPPLPPELALQFEDYTASWHKESKTTTVSNLNIKVAKGEMLAVVGPADSGKTSMLMAVLGEIPRVGGFIRTVGKFAYVSQTPWVYCGSVRENILFGMAMDRRKYNRALGCCDLIHDLESFPDGDLSFIGDRGITLTNVQQAKLCLARAVYQDADTYLIDDVLTTMDSRTAMQLFTKCFCGALNSKTIILVSSNLHFIQAADKIVILKEGKIESYGSYEDLKNINVNLSDVLAGYGFPVPLDTEALELPVDIMDTLKESLTSVHSGGSWFSTLRKRLSQEASSSEESLDSVILECKESSDTTHLLDEDKECYSGGPVSFWLYFKSVGGACSIMAIVIFSVLIQVAFIMSDWWLYAWVKSQDESDDWAMNTTTPSSPASSTSASLPRQFNTAFYSYLCLLTIFLILIFSRALIFSSISIRISNRLHNRLFAAVMRAPLTFYKKYSKGRILSRFSRDMGLIDDPLPATMFDCIQFFCLVLGTVVMVGVTNFWLFLIILPLLFVFIYARFYYMQTARDIKRIELAARGPVCHHLSTTVEGLWTIRAFQSEERFVRYFDSHQDRHTAASYMYLAINRWFAIRLDLLSILIVVPQAFIAILAKQYINGALLGLSMGYTLNLMGLLQYAVRQSAELETHMSSVERVSRFSQLKAEGEAVTSTRPASQWPQYGIVTFEGVTLVLEEEGQKVLKNLWCCIRAEEKVGVLGKPEMAKHALVSVILRLVESSGTVRIDGLDISELGLRDLREKITVVPMDPVLFSGSVRRILDPQTRYPDALLWKALVAVQLKDKVEALPGGMYSDLAQNECIFSLGERQLLCLARAVLRNSKIIIMEETPSVLDRRICNQLKHVLKTKFEQCTVIVIANRVRTVVDADRIMILDEGRVKEFDSAHILLQDPNSQLNRMVQHLPASELASLHHLAKDKYENKPYVQPPLTPLSEKSHPTGLRGQRHFLPSFQTNRLSGVLSHFTGNRFSTNRF